MFGRRKDDEDPFAALRDGGTYQSTPTTIPDLGSPVPPAPQLGSPAPVGQLGSPTPPSRPRIAVRRRSLGLGPWIVLRLVTVAIVIAAVAVPLLSVSSAVHSAISIPSFNFAPTTVPAPSRPSSPPRSYLTPAGLRAGLAQVARLAPGARLALLRIDGDSLSAAAVLRNGVAREIYLGPTGTTVTTGAAAGERPIPISQVRPGAVRRIVVEMGRRFHVAPARIDYMVISSPPGEPPRWIVFSKAPAHPGFSATLSGGKLTALGS